MDATLDRLQYRPSGRVDFVRFGFWYLLLAIPLALVCGLLLYIALRAGFYLVVFMPLIAGALACAGVAAAVHLGRCRNRWVGALAGVLAGLITFFSYYHWNLVHAGLTHGQGLNFIHRVDLLPLVIHERVLTDVQKRVGDPRDRGNVGGNNLGTVDLVFKWVFFSLEALMAVLPGIGAGWAMASRPFDERHRRWMKTYTQQVLPPMADTILTGLTNVGKGELAEKLRPALEVPPEMLAQLKFNYMPDVVDTPIYLTASRLTPVGKNQPMAQKAVLDSVLLDPEEAKVLADAINLPRTGEATRVLPAPAALADKVSGMVTSLPPEEAGQINTRGHTSRAVAIHLSPLILGLLMCVGLLGVVFVTWGAWGVPLRVLAIVLAGAFPVASLVYMVSYEHFLPSLYHHRRVMKVLGARAEPFVDPADREARWVEVIPRAHWVKAMAQNASDVGVLKVDRQRRAILFEGDRERWAIPAESVLSCEIEQFTALGQEPNHLNGYSVVVLAANIEGRPWEAPLYPQSTEFCPRNTAYRKKRAEELRAALAAVLPAGLSEPGA